MEVSWYSRYAAEISLAFLKSECHNLDYIYMMGIMLRMNAQSIAHKHALCIREIAQFLNQENTWIWSLDMLRWFYFERISVTS